MTATMKCSLVIGCALMLQGCITDIVTVPVKIAYGTAKGIVKGTVAVVDAVTPDSDDDDDKKKKD